jgi:hypothetical protein
MMKNVGSRALVALLCGAGFSAACSGGGAVNIGNTTVVGSQLSDYAASWDGYAEAYTFMPDGSDRVRLTIDANGQGTLEVGNAALLPPPTDPNVGYPPGLVIDSPELAPALTGQLVEGFLFPIYATRVQADRIQLGAQSTDLYAAWCALQTPIPSYETTITPDGGIPTSISGASDAGVVSTFYTCAPNLPSMISPTTGCVLINPDQTTIPIDCGKFALCEGSLGCQCNASGCASEQVAAGTPVGNYGTELDGTLDSTGTTLTGTLNLDGTRVTVVLQKQ